MTREDCIHCDEREKGREEEKVKALKIIKAVMRECMPCDVYPCGDCNVRKRIEAYREEK